MTESKTENKRESMKIRANERNEETRMKSNNKEKRIRIEKKKGNRKK